MALRYDPETVPNIELVKPHPKKKKKQADKTNMIKQWMIRSPVGKSLTIHVDLYYMWAKTQLKDLLAC